MRRSRLSGKEWTMNYRVLIADEAIADIFGLEKYGRFSAKVFKLRN